MELPLPPDLSPWAFGLMLVLARIGAAMTLLPGLGETAPPAMLRAGLALCIALLLLRGLGGPLRCPMVVAQHMPGLFTGGFAEHLALASGLDVVEGADDMRLPAGRIVIIAGGCDGEVMRTAAGLRLRQYDATAAGIHPSGDRLFESAAQAARQPVAVVLTGIGRDGTRGARAFAARRLPVLAQSPETSVVWGMPSAVIDAGCVTHVLDVEEIGAELARLSGRSSPVAG